MSLPSFEKVKGDKVLHADASRICTTEGRRACALMQKHGDRDVVDLPACASALTQRDGQRSCAAVQRAASGLWQCPYSGLRNDPFSWSRLNAAALAAALWVLITEHEGRIIQSRSEDSIINEIERL
ncbi:hypothetical protein ACNKHW_19110 [Shigella flexneri]